MPKPKMIKNFKCKECGEMFQSYRQSNYCSASCRSKVYYKLNREKCIQLTKDWEKRNPDKVKARKKAYRDKQTDAKTEDFMNSMRESKNIL